MQSRVSGAKRLLQVLDLIAVKKPSPVNRQNHLRLIQHVLETEIQTDNHQNVNDSAATDSLGESRWDANALSQALTSYASSRSLFYGIQLHGLSMKTGFLSNVYVGSSLMNLYCRCGEVVNGCKLFDEMPVRNVVSWTTVISGFAQEWQVDVCLQLYNRMRISRSKPNDITLTTLLSACSSSGSLGQGRSTHCQTIRMGFESYAHVANALVSMYSKCGQHHEALCAFNGIHVKDVVSWNSMIAGYASHGLASEVINLFQVMKKQKVNPDSFTFLSILSSCRHAGLVEQGKAFFGRMLEHDVEPELDHYACIIDLFGRAGLLEEASLLVENMPIAPNAVIWGSLLSSCRLHGCLHIGIRAAEKRLALEPNCAATHIQLANLYADVGYGCQAAQARKLMKDKGIKTSPGCSWIELGAELHRFAAEDKSNTKVMKIVLVVDTLAKNMSSLCCEPEFDEDGPLEAM
uniref:Pentatricopeptide repeat-containing protein n=1 Tax=Kalanchoe fedtschenkoi TaxID=63787 RepID=A0A7N0ZWC8_KALFE